MPQGHTNQYKNKKMQLETKKWIFVISRFMKPVHADRTQIFLWETSIVILTLS